MSLVVAMAVIFVACVKEAPVSESTPEIASDVKSYAEQIDEWHAGRVERLKADDGWLSVVGLDWIEAGENTLGSNPRSQLVLPEGKAPARAGSIFLENGMLRIEAELDSNILYDGTPVTEMELLPDTSEGTTVLTLGTLRFYPIERGGRFALRIKDSKSEALVGFTEIERYPVDEKWRIEARWVPYDPPKEIVVANVIGIDEPANIIGAVEFEIDGVTYRLDPLAESTEEDLFLIFADQTSGTETYGAGRYLYADPPDENGKVIVDFNKAYNPPCVFTLYATCPLPPLQNRLPVAITAGEKMYGDHDWSLEE
jgi:hypothetical protein